MAALLIMSPGHGLRQFNIHLNDIVSYMICVYMVEVTDIVSKLGAHCVATAARQGSTYEDRGKRLHTRNHKCEIPSENATDNPYTVQFNCTIHIQYIHCQCHGQFQYNLTGQVTIIFKIPLKREIPLEHPTENPLENATGNPR